MLAKNDVPTLTSAQIEQYCIEGFLTIPEAFSGELAKRCEELLLNDLVQKSGISLSSPSKARHPIGRRADPLFDGLITPRVERAFDQLFGPEGWNPAHFETHGDFFITFPGFHGKTWSKPIGISRWHIDLGFESRTEFALEDSNCAFVPAFLITPSLKDGAPTLAVSGSHKMIARLLAAAGRPIPRVYMVAFCEGIVSKASVEKSIVQLNGEAGDVVIMHPFLVHAASANCRDQMRIMGNTGVGGLVPRRVREGQTDRSVSDQTIWNEIEDVRTSPAKARLLWALMAFNHRLWAWRYKVHGCLPSLVEVPLPFWRRIGDAILRPVCSLAARLVLTATR